MHIDLTRSNNFAVALQGVRLIASTLPTPTDDVHGDIDIRVTPEQALTLSNEQGASAVLDAVAAEAAAAPAPAPGPAAPAAEAPAPEPAKPKTIRRSKEETEAGLTIDEAREYRASGLTMAEFLAEIRDDRDESTGPETDPLAGLVNDAASAPAPAQPSLEDQPGMGSVAAATSAPPAQPAVTKEDLQQVVGQLLKRDPGNVTIVRTLAEKHDVQKLSEAPQDKWGEIHAYLSRQLNTPSAADVV